MANANLTQEYLCSIFEYKNGDLYWKNHKYKALNGKKTGCNLEGYLVTFANKKPIYNHQVIFIMHHGYLPYHVDHINGIKHDNRIENLRAANKSENGYNQKTPKNNTSGIKGVKWNKANKTWMVSLGINGKTKYFGSFKDIELAELVAQEARNKYHGQFANHS
jgi:hypothetical protein